MRRPGTALIAAGLVWTAALILVIVVAIAAEKGVAAHGYFAGWLVAISLPLGALPVLMARDLLAAPETPTATALRLLLAALPVLALLIVPVLFYLGGVFPWAPGSHPASMVAEPLKGLAKTWYTPGFFGLRAVVYLLVWVALSLFFVRPAPPSDRQRTVAGLGLGIHALVGTLAAYDWWMSLDAAFLSSVYGLLVMTAQAAFALAVAALASSAAARAAPERPVTLTLLGVLFLAAFVQFSQYLVIWSANLPKEIAWYQARWVDPLGPIFVIGLPVLLVLAFAVLIPSALASMRLPALVGLGGVLLLAVLDLVCLACPNGTFTFGGLGLVLAFLIVVGGLGAAGASVVGGRLLGGLRHG